MTGKMNKSRLITGKLRLRRKLKCLIHKKKNKKKKLKISRTQKKNKKFSCKKSLLIYLKLFYKKSKNINRLRMNISLLILKVLQSLYRNKGEEH